jgi:hypothetical protein
MIVAYRFLCLPLFVVGGREGRACEVIDYNRNNLALPGD